MSETPNRFSENVGIDPVIVAELERGRIERKVFDVDFVKRADNVTLEDRPGAFDGLGVDCTANVQSCGAFDGLVLRELAIQMV